LTGQHLTLELRAASFIGSFSYLHLYTKYFCDDSFPSRRPVYWYCV